MPKADRALAAAKQLLAQPGKEHDHDGVGTCRVCAQCHSCTGWGPSCVKVFGKDRCADAGQACGCGQGQNGCKHCTLCRTCCKANDKAHAAALAAAAALVSEQQQQQRKKLRPLPGRRGSELVSQPVSAAGYREEGSCTGKPPAGIPVKPPKPTVSRKTRLPHFPSVFSFEPKPARWPGELELIELAGAIRDKKGWTEKLKNPEVTARWRAEAAAQGASKAEVKYIFQQLKYEATQQSFGTEGAVPGTFSYDGLVPDGLRQELLQQVARLEALPKDWHPGSKKQVLDLVHPSLFCTVFNVSKQLPEGIVNLDNCLRLAGAGSPVAPPFPGMKRWRSHFLDSSVETQWLPTNFEVGASGGVCPLSYINNLHPRQYKELYGVVSRILGLMRPLFERTLAALAPKGGAQQRDKALDEAQEGKKAQERAKTQEEAPHQSTAGQKQVDAQDGDTAQGCEAHNLMEALEGEALEGKAALKRQGAPEEEAALERGVAPEDDAQGGVETEGHDVQESEAPKLHRPVSSTTAELQRNEAGVKTFTRLKRAHKGTTEAGAPAPSDDGQLHQADNGKEDKRTEDAGDEDAGFSPGSDVEDLEDSEDEDLEDSDDEDMSGFGSDFDDLGSDFFDFDEWGEPLPRPPKLPSTFTLPKPPTPVDLRGRKLQVIVKLANIILTPQKPRYKGGSWHVEGMRNESIIATGIYYYDQDNVTESHLAFREHVRPSCVGFDGMGELADGGLDEGDPLSQVLGQVTTLEGRCLCFPNTYQHQVQPFELRDKSRPGHRKILVYFLVDPWQSVLSTSEIPPQQLDWWKQEVFQDMETKLGALPDGVTEVLGKVIAADSSFEPAPEPQAQPEESSDSDGHLADHAADPDNSLPAAPSTFPCPFSLELAQHFRAKLMEERKAYVGKQNEYCFEQQFSFCEH